METRYVNYLHFGAALVDQRSIDWWGLSGIRDKKEILDAIERHKLTEPGLREILRGYGRLRSKKVDVDKFISEINQSLLHQSQFRAMRCRGFSYRVQEKIRFAIPLAKRITLRHALVAGGDLFYPPRLKAYLRRVSNNHCFSGGFPSIAFALGAKSRDGWFVFVLQSDLVFCTPSYVRDHFRGWARVLFLSVVERARAETTAVYLCRAVDALRTCHPVLPVPKGVPSSWESIYDSTAFFFGMELVRLDRPVNIQLYPRRNPVHVTDFYKLSLGSDPHAAWKRADRRENERNKFD